MDEKNIKPDLVPGRKTLVITQFDPQLLYGGTSMLMRNLLLSFDSDRFEIISSEPAKPADKKIFSVNYLLTNVYAWRRPIQKLLSPFTVMRDARRVQKKLDEYKPGAIFIVYPHLYNVRVFLRLKLPKGIKVVGYFHDTFVEGQLHNYPGKYLNTAHSKLLSVIDTLFVMNEGMKSLYHEKYKYPTVSLEHTYPEYDEAIRQPDNGTTQDIQNTAFWGGMVLGYNARSLARLISCFEKAGVSFEIASKQKAKSLAAVMGNLNYRHTSYGREAYVIEVKHKKFLILALNWPDETMYHFDEISTIFSTKTIEYLLSGRPIILHCPKEYFMAKFFLKHKCGFVISEKDPEMMQDKLEQILREDHQEVICNARNIAAMFSPSAVLSKYREAVSKL